ncbi:MAG TPA: tetratricopeptide repeat protein, partial [Anaerolineales bacterium]
EWIKNRRKCLDLTQAELAQRAGCSLPALRKIEAGGRRPSKQLAGLLARTLDLPSEDHANFVKVARGELNIERLRSPRSASPAEHLSEKNFYAPQVNLPVQPTLLFGREAELTALGRLLSDPHCRLLTIIGMGGIGKTRLAVEIASQQQGLFPGGVYYVSLAPISSPEFIVSAIAEVFGLTFSGTIDPQVQLFNHLAVRTKQALLLVLDNLEHLLLQTEPAGKTPDTISLLAEITRRLPNVKVLVTSRERVGIQGEWIFELHGLPFPTSDLPSRLESYSAIALFLQRARQVRTDFKVEAGERSSLVRVCQLVEGTPLAIELAAAWVGVLSIDEIASEIASSLDFLRTTLRDVPERHSSLRATFDHSWNLLSAEEQNGLSRLAVFRGGFEREAAERVAGVSLSILMSLFSKSLLLRRENGRYDLNEVVRQYALSHLHELQQYEATHERYCEFYLALVQEQEKAIEGAAQVNAIQVLRKELDNLRAVMSYSFSQGNHECILSVATSLGKFWINQGYWREGLEWLERGLGGRGLISNINRAKGLTIAGWLSRYLGEYPRAIRMLREALTLWRQIDDPGGISLTLCNLGASLLHQGDCTSATALLEEALRISEQQGDRSGMSFSLEILGHTAYRRGNFEKSIELYNRALILARQSNDENQITKLLASIGDEYILMGDYDQAEGWFSQAGPLSQKLGNRIVDAFIISKRG